MRSLSLTSLVALSLLAACASPSKDAASNQSNEVRANGNEEAGASPAWPAALPVQWPNRGSNDCRNFQNSDPSIYVFQYDENTWILRENKCLNYEANFLYVLFGKDKVLLQDTGSLPRGITKSKFSELFQLRNTVEGLISTWLAAHPNADGSARTRESIELLVTHSHSHGDHVSGDYQFVNNGVPYPHTQIAGLRPSDVASFFGIANWPNGQATLDLGNRKIDVLPIPGHENSHVALYDHGAKLLLSGDSLYPGHLFINSWGTYTASMKKLGAWMHETDETGAPKRPIDHALGNHIEMTPGQGQFWEYGTPFHPTERKLELSLTDLDFLAQKSTEITANPGRELFFDNFAMDASNAGP